jgi:hypothetical protein
MGLLSKAISIQVIAGNTAGLLRKLTVYTTRSDPGPGRDNASPGHRSVGAGLLHKSLLLLNLNQKDAQGNESLLIVGESAHIDRVLERIDLLSEDFSFFPGLYALLIRELSLPRSAFFLYNGWCGRFTPWLSRGLDPSLSAVLEFTEDQWRGTLSPAFRLESGRRLFPALTRELPQPLYLFPFVHQGTLEGGLLVSNFALHPESRGRVEALFTTLSRKVGSSIARITQPLAGLSRPERAFTSPEAALPALLDSGSGRPDMFVVINLPLEALFENLARERVLFDRRRLREILLYVVNSYFSHLGAAVPRGDENIVLVLRAARLYSQELLTATLSQLLSNVFQGLFRSPPALVPSRVFEYPACGMKPLEIAAAL